MQQKGSRRRPADGQQRVAMSSPRVHVLTCYVALGHDSSYNATLLARTMPTNGSVRLTNVCEHVRPSALHSKFGLNALKLEMVRHFATTHTSVGSNDLLIVADTDVIVNTDSARAALDHDEVIRRFEKARRGFKLLFQAEPWCWAPYTGSNHKPSWSSHRPSCRPDVLTDYNSTPDWSSNWRCPRFLNSGLYAGWTSDVLQLASFMDNASSWPGGTPLCFEADDQCLATHFMLRHPGWVRLDVQQQLLATGARPTVWSAGHTTRASVPCGSVAPCRCDGSFNSAASGWRDSEWHIDRTSQLDVWCKPTRTECGDAPAASGATVAAETSGDASPLMIHLNGQCKDVLAHQVADWIARRAPVMTTRTLSKASSARTR